MAITIVGVVWLEAQVPQPKPKPHTQPGAPETELTTGLLLIDTSEDCRLQLDEKEIASLNQGKIRVIPLGLGQHRIKATSIADGLILDQSVEVIAGKQEAVLLDFTQASPFRLNDKDGLEYVHLHRGIFQMGCSGPDRSCKRDEVPPHQVVISRDYWIVRTAVTVNAYRKSVSERNDRANTNLELDGNAPQTGITWQQASAFCSWAGGRLPTEAEWEYAARGGEQDMQYPSGNNITHDDANYSGKNGRDQWITVAPVASFPANAYGIFDMAGNVWEWCADWYSPDYYGASPTKDPRGPETGETRVLRGGAWNSTIVRLRVSSRDAAPPHTAVSTIGFRCVRDLAP